MESNNSNPNTSRIALSPKTGEITNGPIARAVISLAIPAVIGQLMQFSMSIINLFWVGRLGPSAQDAITTSMVVIWTVYASSSIFVVGVTAMVSRAVGASDLESAKHTIRQATLFASLVSIFYAFVGYALTPSILVFMGTSSETSQQAIPYIRVFFLSNVFMALSETLYAAFRASGNTRTPTIVGVVAVLTNAILDPILIFGLGPIPALGVAGAALATACSMVLSTILILRSLRDGKMGYQVEGLLRAGPNWRAIRKLARIGLPVTIQQISFVAVYWFLMSTVHSFGDAAGAAMGIGNRMESLSYLTCWGFSIAASTMVGQNLGANNPARASRGAWGSMWLAVSATFVTSLLFVSIPHLIASIFTNDARVLSIASDYIFILGISQTFMAVEIVLEGAFSGAGDTLPPMLVLLPGVIVRIPLAHYLAFQLGLGISGVWWTLTITTIIKASVLALWFSRGKWQMRAV